MIKPIGCNAVTLGNVVVSCLRAKLVQLRYTLFSLTVKPTSTTNKKEKI